MLCWGGFFLFLFPSLIVKCLVYFLEVLIGDMGVDLRRGDGCVSEHRLDASDIRAIGEEIGRESVPKRVRMDIFDDAGFGGVVLTMRSILRGVRRVFLVPGSCAVLVRGGRKVLGRYLIVYPDIIESSFG